MLALFGPTASGKSAVAEAIADEIPAEIVSADSMQVYRGLPILTNQADAPAHLVAVWDLDHEASVAEYARLAHAAIDGVLGRLPDAGRRRRHGPLLPRRAGRARGSACTRAGRP